ncbi:MAG: hypothetical protein JWL77_231 [Chthonomonadaceae bacterium]|nr:hypothetical protein [Chthonomonadaceae bacterium]
MAYYLRRAFAAVEEIRIFHDLRLEHKGEVAQIDHLVLHRWGIVLIESKSVTTTVRVNKQGEWARRVQGRWQGMPSPVLQVRRQGDLLKILLRENTERLLDKILVLQFGFGYMPVDCLVAISDVGIIERVGNPNLPEVCKSDQVTERVTALVTHYRKVNSLLTTLVGGDDKGSWHTLRPQEMQRISDFLLQRHTPLSLRAPMVAASSEAEALPLSEVCAQCGRGVTPAVARYCRDQERRFGGKIYCMEHQRGWPNPSSPPPR